MRGGGFFLLARLDAGALSESVVATHSAGLAVSATASTVSGSGRARAPPSPPCVAASFRATSRLVCVDAQGRLSPGSSRPGRSPARADLTSPGGVVCSSPSAFSFGFGCSPRLSPFPLWGRAGRAGRPGRPPTEKGGPLSRGRFSRRSGSILPGAVSFGWGGASPTAGLRYPVALDATGRSRFPGRALAPWPGRAVPLPAGRGLLPRTAAAP